MKIYVETQAGLHKYVIRRIGRRLMITTDDVASARKVEKDFRNIFMDAQVYQDDAVGFRKIEPDIEDGAESARRIGFVVEKL